MTAITIPADVRAAMYRHARAAFPAECCGYLVGPRDAAAVDELVACRNAQADGDHPIAPERGADTGFVIAGAELFRFARGFDGDRPPHVVYHSHTNGQAYLSRVDRALADGPAYPVQHVVIGVTAEAITEVAQFAWSARHAAYVEVARWPGPEDGAA
ncbi:MAG TPA: Mov34/MPN/PAD-1 family protein [Kofleriaceae bacterium]|nr:Mov34/MPN/PAD-1 family protein [Kofleriaceae bacterium]